MSEIRSAVKLLIALVVATVGVPLVGYCVVGIALICGGDWRHAFEGIRDLEFGLELAPGYKLCRPWSSCVEIMNPTVGAGIVVPSKVIAVGMQDNFITAIQDAPADSGRVARTNSLHYWIVQTRTDNVLGPLPRTVFETKCREFGIDSSPESMKPIDFYWNIADERRQRDRERRRTSGNSAAN